MLVKKGASCKWPHESLGLRSSAEACAKACKLKRGCTFFAYASDGSKVCNWEKTAGTALRNGQEVHIKGFGTSSTGKYFYSNVGQGEEVKWGDKKGAGWKIEWDGSASAHSGMDVYLYGKAGDRGKYLLSNSREQARRGRRGHRGRGCRCGLLLVMVAEPCAAGPERERARCAPSPCAA